jgi:heptaprenyl diphosphate synthase
VPVPGVKLGLANIITLVAMVILGRKEAGAVLFVRVFLGSLFAGSPSTLIYSAAGGFVAYLVMCALIGSMNDERLWLLSALSAIGHNAGQLGACAIILKTPGILVTYAPVLAISGVSTGIFTGLAAMYLIRALRKMKIDYFK